MMRIALFMLAFAATTASAKGPDLSPSAAIRKADLDWSAAFSARDLDAAVAVMDESGRVLSPNMPVATTPAAIRTQFKATFALPEVKISWKPDLVQAARSGEIGYSSGRYTMSWMEDRKTLSDQGKYATIWKKQRNGQWKVLLDIFNSDIPAR
jgi:ketosteroid isomerase-like protein